MILTGFELTRIERPFARIAFLLQRRFSEIEIEVLELEGGRIFDTVTEKNSLFLFLVRNLVFASRDESVESQKIFRS